MRDLDRWVPLAAIARPHGVRGELRLKLFNTSSDVLLQMDEVLVRLEDGEEHEVSVDTARRADDAILMKLYSIDDRDRADELRGALVCVRRSAFPPLEEGEIYTIDLVGAEARQGDRVFGTVTDLVAYPTMDALVVRAADAMGALQDWEIPMIESYVGAVDVDAGTVEVVSLDDLEPTPVRKVKAAPPPAPAPAAKVPGEKRVPKWKAKRDAAKAAAGGSITSPGEAEGDSERDGSEEG